jgi:FlaA1/EpsC-like NDP-sugar epimerase
MNSGNPFPAPIGKTVGQHVRQFATSLVVYIAFSLLALLVSSLLRFEFHIPPHQYPTLQFAAVCLAALNIVGLWCAGQMRSQFPFFGAADVIRISLATGATTIVSVVLWYASQGAWAPPRSIAILQGVFFGGMVVGFRLGCRLLWERRLARASAPRPVAIIGAGRAGARLANELLRSPGLQLRPVLFVDDDPGKHRTTIHSIPVWGSPEALADQAGRLRISEALIAMPSAPLYRIRQIVSLLATKRIPCRTLPSFESFMLQGGVETKLRPVQIEDLLQRKTIELSADTIEDMLRNRTVAVTGAGGSIGSELCRQILGYQPARLVLIEQCEVQLFTIEQQLLAAGILADQIVSLVADVTDSTSMELILEQHRPTVLFHAAAHKHVPMMEYQPWEAFLNNTIGTMRLADAAIKARVERFILISTDKAINPTNVMGATKRMAELYLQAVQQNTTSTRLMAVRFGNVLGSSGSVIPTFRKQIAAGGPVTVTHPEVVRYFMTIPEAAGLVLQSAVLGQGGEIFVLDMGNPIKIADLAQQMIELSGLRVGLDIEIKFTGLRPGEKLYEELNHTTENMAPTSHPKVMRFTGQPASLAALRPELEALLSQRGRVEMDAFKQAIQRLVPEYVPHLSRRPT